MGKTGLIGHTGFVGGTLARATAWDACYNSANIDTLRGQAFDLLVCAGVSAVKWQANKDPERDRAGIARLTDALGQAQAKEFILISTIDVYPDPASGADEATPIDPAINHAYGRHRFELERWAETHFNTVRVVRLPALFGPGLRKNAIHDLLTGTMLDAINPAGEFQWYPLERFWGDLSTVRANDLRLINLFTQPLAMSRILDGLFAKAPVGPARLPAPRYDLHTRHGALFGGDARYVMGAAAVFDALARFVTASRRTIAGAA